MSDTRKLNKTELLERLIEASDEVEFSIKKLKDLMFEILEIGKGGYTEDADRIDAMESLSVEIKRLENIDFTNWDFKND